LKILVFGIGFGIAFQAWRNYPADGPVSANMVGLVTILGMLGAYFAGRIGRSSYSSASAYASAHAEANAEASSSSTAQQTVQVAFIVPGQGAATAGGVNVPDPASVSWAAAPRAALDVDQLDGMDVRDLASELDAELVADE
jgi:hypothetical protein